MMRYGLLLVVSLVACKGGDGSGVDVEDESQVDGGATPIPVDAATTSDSDARSPDLFSDAGITLAADASPSNDASTVGGFCNPLTQAGCTDFEKCTQVVESENPYLTTTTCVPDGNVPLNGTCSEGAPGPQTGYDDCVAGTLCIEARCREVCSIQGDSCRTPQQGFGEGGYCTGYAGLFEGDIGICNAACHPSADNVVDGAVIHDRCGETGCFVNLNGRAASCSQVPGPAVGRTQGESCYTAPSGGCYLNGCEAGYSPILQDDGSRLCARSCTPINTHNSSLDSVAGGQGRCTSQSLSAAGSSTVGAHQCRFVQTFYSDGENMPDSVGMCVPAEAGDDCTELDWDGILAATEQDGEEGYNLFCTGTAEPTNQTDTFPRCMGMFRGCLSLEALDELYDLL